MKKYFLKYILLFAVLCGWLQVYAGATPEETFRACVTKLKSAKSIKSDFTMVTSQGTMSGTLYSKGIQFALSGKGFGTWYDGSEIWTLNPTGKAVNVWIPTASELAESNPLLYLSTASDYKVTSAPGAKKGEIRLILTPAKRNSGVKSILLTLSSSTTLPTSMEITSGATKYTIRISSLSLGAAIPANAFKFPKKKYPDAKVVRL